MRSSTLQRRSLRYYWRAQLATAICAAVAAAVLTGSLVVGDSMRASLRQQALRRLGGVEQALMAPGFFRDALPSFLAANDTFKARFERACPLILSRGAVEHAGNAARYGRVNVLGVDEQFWQALPTAGAAVTSVAPGSIVLNETLARALNARPGDDCLVRLGVRGAAPAETLLGRTEQATVSMRLTVQRVIPDAGPGALDLNLSPDEPRNAYVALSDLQRAMKQPRRANTLLVIGRAGRAPAVDDDEALRKLLAVSVQLEDFGLKLRTDKGVAGVVVESESLLLTPAVEKAVLAAAAELRAPTTPVLTYLANTLALIPTDGTPEVPYSTVSGVGASGGQVPGLTLMDGNPAPALGEREILLNEWTAGELKAQPGERVRMTWYTSEAFQRLDTADAVFTVRGIVRMEGLAVDPTLAPEYEGITNAKHLSGWNPPFPVDMKRVRAQDEAYWDEHGPTPKAFVALATAQKLWAAGHSRFGQLTSIRLGTAPGKDRQATADEFRRVLPKHLPPQTAGLAFQPLRARALAASQGNTDFGSMFLAFSFFLIVSAAMLTALLFRLGTQRRAAEIGLLLAVGWRRGAVMRQLLAEAAWPAGAGAAVGLLGAVGYSALMLAGLRGWWAGAIDAGFLKLYVVGDTLLIGWTVSLVIALLSMAWSIRGLCRQSPRELLAGGREDAARTQAPRRVHLSWVIATVTAMGAATMMLLAALERMPMVPAFFGSGTATLVSFLAMLRFWARSPERGVIRSGGWVGIGRLGIRNAARNPLRTLLTAGLVASAAFVVTAVGANRRAADESDEKDSGTGGFTLMAESTVPVLQDMNSPAGRKALGLSAEGQEALASARVIPFRLRPGDETSCAGLYQPTQPRILGAMPAMIARGGFTFSAHVAQSGEQAENPWLLLKQPMPDGAVPTIGDESTVIWLLHLGLADDFVMTDEHGKSMRLRIVGLLAGSALQSELIIDETQFTEHFPSIGGYSFFLIETHGGAEARLGQMLERDLSRYGLETTPMAARLARYVAVENAYMSAFQTLGGLGMVLGTLGLGAVLMRTVLDRRGELALLAALGFRARQLRWLVLVEHVAILLFGLVAGVVTALLASTPQIATHPQNIAWLSLSATLLAVLLTGIVAGVLATAAALRGRLPASLRNE